MASVRCILSTVGPEIGSVIGLVMRHWATTRTGKLWAENRWNVLHVCSLLTLSLDHLQFGKQKKRSFSQKSSAESCTLLLRQRTIQGCSTKSFWVVLKNWQSWLIIPWEVDSQHAPACSGWWLTSETLQVPDFSTKQKSNNIFSFIKCTFRCHACRKMLHYKVKDLGSAPLTAKGAKLQDATVNTWSSRVWSAAKREELSKTSNL